MTMHTTNYRIRIMNKKDVKQVVFVHMNSFKGFFLAQLGESFLKVLYSFIVADKECISIVAESNQNNEVIGFVVGTISPTNFYSKAIKKKILAFALAAVPTILQQPRLFNRLIRALKKPSEMKSIEADCELMSIAVLPDYFHKNVGKVLELSFVNEAKKRHVKVIMLTTDSINNDKVIKFYENCGYTLRDIFNTPEGRLMNRYIKKL